MILSTRDIWKEVHKCEDRYDFRRSLPSFYKYITWIFYRNIY